MHAKQILIRLLVIYCTFNIRQSNKEVCFHFNSQPCSQAVIIFDADHLKYKQSLSDATMRQKLPITHNCTLFTKGDNISHAQ